VFITDYDRDPKDFAARYQEMLQRKNIKERSKKKWKVICSSEDFYMINICLDCVL
jgi:hypothetical protein